MDFMGSSRAFGCSGLGYGDFSGDRKRTEQRLGERGRRADGGVGEDEERQGKPILKSIFDISKLWIVCLPETIL